MDGMQALKCDFCGGRLIVDDSREFATCEMCGTKYMKSTIQQKIQEIRGSVTVEGEVQVKQTEFTIRGGTLERYNGSATEVTIPDGVTYIGDEAFKDCRGIKSVAIPKTVVGIGIGAFSGCTSLENINLPDGLTEIRRAAFVCCSSLKSIVIPESVENLEHMAFLGCSSLTQVTLSAKWQKDLSWFAHTPWYKQLQIGFMNNGLCKHCGGQFAGVIKKCSVCGKRKDY